ncbi:MAG: indole-3-glycerol phosphate synthase TrpC [Verrucomicrobia bacterium]|nr:indole-3-glycerol phosphate synthase TrpC [Verrucomicrobiota bacterium]
MSILDTIVEQKKREVEALGALKASAGDIALALLARGDDRDFARALLHPRKGTLALIAEVKKASPSAGVICPNFDPVRTAKEYEAAGANCLSVLTDEKFFQGSLSHLKQIREAVRLPLLRKDFIIDSRQIREAVDWGADAILLIVSILSDAQLREFHALAADVGLAALVEVHDESELERALAAGATLIGVNNRDLKTFQVDLGTTERLAGRIRHSEGGEHRILVSESGIHSKADMARLVKAGVQAVLIGESLMKESNIPGKIGELLD